MSIDALTVARPLRADARRNYDAILKVAAEAFAEHGVQTSLDDIAKRAGVGPGTLYLHFPTRDSLLVAALVESRQELDRIADDLITKDDPAAALNAWLLALASHLSTYDGLPDSVVEAVRDQESALCASCSRMVSSTDRLVQHAREAGVIRGDVSGDDLFVIANSLAWATNKKGYGAADLERLLTMFTAGLK